MPRKPRATIRAQMQKAPDPIQPARADVPASLRDMDVAEFARRLAQADKDDLEKRFALFLGAGCSVTSGIPAATDLVSRRWLPRLRDVQAPERKDVDAWAQERFPDYEPARPALFYGNLIDQLFVTPQDRQQEIEALCEGKTPSFGYAVLAQLVATKADRFNVVLTTNFDDMVADALYLYTDKRPLVIQHESLAAFIRPTRTRPLVVKLHGDHRLAPRNTVLETETLEKAIRHQTAMVLNDRGLIFIGYGGADVGIHKLLEELPPEALPLGVYWVHPEPPSGPIARWLGSRNGVWARSGWFDHVMVVVREAFGLPHPTRKRFDQIFETYQKQFEKLSAEVMGPGSIAPAAVQAAVTAAKESLPDDWRAVLEGRRLEQKDPDGANAHYRAALERYPKMPALLGTYAIFLTTVRKDHDAAEGFYKRALEADPNHATTLGNYANFLKTVRKDHDAAEGFYKRALEADPNHAHHLGNYGGFLFARDRPEGLSLVERALAGAGQGTEPLQAECEFYLFANGPAAGRGAALRQLKVLLSRGARSPGWDLSGNVAAAERALHPDVAWLRPLAAVIGGDADLSTLADWPAWRAA